MMFGGTLTNGREMVILDNSICYFSIAQVSSKAHRLVYGS